jgi:hypothetical protein
MTGRVGVLRVVMDAAMADGAHPQEVVRMIRAAL